MNEVKHSMKRGMIVGLVLLVVAALALLAVVGIAGTRSTEEGKIQACVNSARARSMLEFSPFYGGEIEVPIPLLCDRNKIIIYPHSVTKTVKKETQTLPVYDPVAKKQRSQFPSPTPEIVNSLVAEQVKNCWQRFDEGRTAVLQNDMTMWGAGDWGDNEMWCFVCAVISFDPEVQYPPPSATTEQLDFSQYLQERYVVKKWNTTYHTYLTQYNGACTNKKDFADSCFEDLLLRKNFKLDIAFNSMETYAVLLVREGEEKTQYALASYVIPIENINRKVCTWLVA